jgi:dynein heavy chain, axonemal
MNAAAV